MPYDFEWDDKSSSYVFTTSSTSVYNIFFSEDEHLNVGDEENSVSKVYQILVVKSPNEEGKKRYDPRVCKTIVCLVDLFFDKDHDNTLVFTCSNDDGKGQSRDVLFKRWYRDYTKENYEKIDNFIELDDIKMFTGMILNCNNTKYQLILERYSNLERSFKDL